MTDQDLIAKRLALIETYVRELRTLAKPREISTERRERRFAEHTLQIAIQAALDVASLVVENHLGDLLDFVVALRARLASPGS
jgi:uncharacterized protein YutE (UPF0331/DUF86 family)